MAKQTILNGTFDNDPAAEKTRDAFTKVNANFTEIYTTVPQVDASTLSGQTGKFLKVNSGETAFELAAVAGGGDLLASNNLSDVASAATSRTNLGLGTAAVADLLDEDDMVSDSATDAPSQQSVKAFVEGNTVQSLQAGTGINIDATDPTSPIVTATGTANNVTGVTFAPSTGVLTITRTSGSVTVDLSEYTVLKIDGYIVDKDSGNSDTEAIEVNDIIRGYPSATKYIHGKVNALPYTTAGNVDYFVNSEL